MSERTEDEIGRQVRDHYARVPCGASAFSPTRSYCGVLSGASRLGRHEQLWVAALDPAGAGDPSRPAFRLPFQDLNEGNHRPFWALDRVAASCAASGSPCAASTDCCAPGVCHGGACGPACGPVDARCATDTDYCAPSVCRAGTCATPCRATGAACAAAADCCTGVCPRGSCASPPCRSAGGSCGSDADCCAGACVGGGCAPS